MNCKTDHAAGQQLFPRTPLLAGNDAEAKRAEIRCYFHATCDRYESLFELLACDDAYYKKSIPLRHPLIFYLGHTATFFINKLILAGLITQRINPGLESMFAIGVDEMSWDDLADTHYEWPTPAEVFAYRRAMREIVDGVIAGAPLTGQSPGRPKIDPAPSGGGSVVKTEPGAQQMLPVDWKHPFWVVLMGIEHERIHLETSSVLIRQHVIEYVKPHPAWAPCRESGAAPRNQLVDIAAGKVRLGKAFDDPVYGWDNEYGRHEADIEAFQASRYLVSNQEFLGFVEAGGYHDDTLWEEEGRAWKEYTEAHYPTFWVRSGTHWLLRLMAEEVPMRWDWPVETNYHEAKAFCHWKARATGQPVRLPTEDEWNRLYDSAGLGEIPAHAPAAANLHLDHWASSCPVTQFRHGADVELYDVVGNVWQWTETPTYPFEGFAVHPLYDDFTTPTFDGRHNLIKGGSWIACGNEAVRASRYAFRRHFFQHAGFRYVVAKALPSALPVAYESDRMLSEYSEFHYGDQYFGVANFSKALAEIAIRAMGSRPARKALDLGCATGRATFELAKHFDRVTGIDFSARFIGAGVKLAESGVLRYTLAEEGELVSYKERTLAQLGLEAVRGKVEFYQGDACNLKDIFTGYDLVLAANLIDRLYSPAKFLTTIHERIKAGGLLLIASPYTWLEEYTPRADWVGGFKRDGENFTTLAGLKEMLSPHFKLIEGPREVPFVIRETKRKHQHTLSEVTIWERG